MSPAGWAFLAAVLAVGAGLSASADALGLARRHTPRALRAAVALWGEVAATGRDGRDPGARERRRLLAAGAAGAFALGLLLVGPLAALLAACAGPWAVARLLRARRERYRRGVDAGAGAVALAVADALTGGHSLPGALATARAPEGPAGRELARVRAELELGVPTEEVLEAFRARVRSERIDALVAAMMLQRRAGGDLARLLRESAGAFEAQSRSQEEARAATAQARFTGQVVALLPVGGAGLAELASPGFAGKLTGSLLSLWLVGVALVLQAVAAVAIRRLAQVHA